MEKVIEFEFVDENGNIEFELGSVFFMIAEFNCLVCGTLLKFSKKYDPVPEHYESLLKKCDPVSCPKCFSKHFHLKDFETGEDMAVIKGSRDN